MTGKASKDVPDRLSGQSISGRVVAVGCTHMSAGLLTAGELTEATALHFLSFAEVLAGGLREHQPDVLISPVFGPDFDAMELAQCLADLQWTGPYRALAEDLPRPEVISREVSRAVPGVDFAVIRLKRAA